MACLDTCVFIDLSRRPGEPMHRRARDRIADIVSRGETPVTTRFNIAELQVGVERSDRPEVEREKISRILAGLDVLEFDDRAAQAFGRIVARLQSEGEPIGDMDALIAAVSLVNGHSVVTRNVRHLVPEFISHCRVRPADSPPSATVQSTTIVEIAALHPAALEDESTRPNPTSTYESRHFGKIPGLTVVDY